MFFQIHEPLFQLVPMPRICTSLGYLLFLESILRDLLGNILSCTYLHKATWTSGQTSYSSGGPSGDLSSMSMARAHAIAAGKSK